MNIKEIKQWADRRQDGEHDAYDLIHALCEIVESQQAEIAALKPRGSGWGPERPPRPSDPPRQINLANTHRQEIETFARSQGYLPY